MLDLIFTGLDFANEAEISRIARLHQKGPLAWIEGYEVSEKAVKATFDVLSESQENPKTHVIVARVSDKLLGFHWLSITSEDSKLGRIESLWVDEKYRNKGIAKRLKEHGEVWLKEKGVTRVKTAVFYVNKRMIDINLKAGFTPGQVEMTKKL